MRQKLNSQFKKLGLIMDYSDTKVMTNTEKDATVEIRHEITEQYKEYLGQPVKLSRQNQSP